MKTMMRTVAIVLALGMLAHAQAPTAKKATRRRDIHAVTVEEVNQLRDALAAQQEQLKAQQQQLQQLREELARKDETWRQAQAVANVAQSRLASIEAKNNHDSEDLATLKSDVTDIKSTLTNVAVNSQEEQKRLSGVQAVLDRFRLSGDVRVRYENFFQSFSGCAAPTCNPRHRERLRLRAGFEGKLSEDFYGGVYMATGDLTDPGSTNQTMTGFFERKSIGWDRGWLTFQPRSHKWLQLTGGKFAYTWNRTPLTFDSDLNPEGFSQKLSFDTSNPVIKNISFTGMQLLFNESSGGADSFAAGGQISTKLKLGDRITLTPSVTVLNWRNANTIANAVATGSLTGNAMTNATSADKKQFLSKFLYTDYILDTSIKTPWPRFPVRLVLDYLHNPNAVASNNDGYWAEIAFGQTKEKGDIQFGYTFARVEQDAAIAAFIESDFRAPTNLLQHKLNFQYQVARNTTLSYTGWIGHTLDTSLQNAQNKTGNPLLNDPFLTRMQFDVIYKF